ncbi:hypothetical protein L596_016910 [Steinernema carpocapsae]|uniref:C-type lectin domain-containing protein n=1 Tax=Steinernema carpocapsae TaxID=34508 RepID=A0A4U5NJC5_STECR|nr:hypothetical protein L596_016910 [Steinernema carpocapsae]
MLKTLILLNLASVVLSTIFTYKAFVPSLNWSNAEAYCQSQKGHLANIQNGAESKAVRQALDTAGFSTGWIGLRFNALNSASWTDGSEFSSAHYQNWYPGFPNGEDTCIFVSKDDFWINGLCDALFPFVCKLPVA